MSVFLRFFSFFPSVIDHDESTYLEMSRQLLAGKTLYVDMIDIKPPGIFLILAGLQAVFGYSIFLMRLLVSLWIGLTAFLVYLTGRLIFKDNRAALAAGIIYVFFLSTWSFYGISITPEIIFNLFTITSLYVLMQMKSGWKYLLAGLIAGFGFIVKYFVIMDFAVIVLFSLVLEKRDPVNRISKINMISRLLLAGLGFLLPFALINLYYFSGDHWDEFFNIIYLAPQRYPSPIDPARMSVFLLDLQAKFFPFFLFFYYALIEKKFKPEGIRGLKWFFGIWTLATLLTVVISGNHYGHYTIQLMLPVSMMAGYFFHSKRVIPLKIRWVEQKNRLTILVTVLVVIISAMKLEYFFKKDYPREIAEYLKPRLLEDDVIYTGNYHHILYYLLKKDSPTPYIHRTLLTEEEHLQALDIDQDEAFDRIIASRPAYIITQKEYPQNAMKEFIINNYRLEKEFEGKAKVWRRVD